MDIPKFKDITKKLSFFKDYSSLTVPAVIGLVAVFLFIITPLMGSKLVQQIESESISKGGKQIKRLRRNVPSSGQCEMEQEYQRRHKIDANEIELLALQSAKRPLLSYRIFPEPTDTSAFLFKSFGQQFRGAIDSLITGVNGRDCPSEAELELAINLGSSDSSGKRRLSGKLGDVEATIVDALCQKKAESASVYVNPADIGGYEFWQEYPYVGRDKAVEDCWYWQLGYWIIEDVFHTIGELNSSSRNVLASPVKRLVDIGFTTSDSRFERSEVSDRPRYVYSAEDWLCQSWTRRISNDDIDIVHFNIVVLADTKAILPFMKQLCSAKEHKFRGFFNNEPEQSYKHDQITILESTIDSIDHEDEDEQIHKYYRYGEDALVKLNLICEYIFHKKGYDEIKPELLKKQPEIMEQGRSRYDDDR